MSVADIKKNNGPLSGWTELPRKIVAMELFERLFILCLFLNFLNTIFGKSAAPLSLVSVLLVFSEMLPLILIFSRGPTETMSLKPIDWVVGLAGSSAPLLVIAPAPAPLVPSIMIAMLMVLGLSIQVTGKLFLGRSFGVVAANRGVKVGGLYRIVRHPIYMGYTFTHIGFLLAFPYWQNLLIYTFTLAMQVMRIFKEEAVLGQDPRYQEFMGQVRYRLVPGLF